MKTRKTLINVFSSLISYSVLLLVSIISSKYVLVGYGSETNGLLSSVNQLFSYIALIEAGIGTSTINSLYYPISQKNDEGVTDVLSASRNAFRTSAKWYFVCVLVMSFIWPLLLNTTISYLTIWSVIFFQGISGVITYCYVSVAVSYLTARGKNYVNNSIHLLATIITYVLKIIISCTSLSVVFISISMVAVNVLKCLVYALYLKKIYPAFFVRKKADISLLKQRNSFFVHQLSSVIFYSTDTIIIALFCSLREASVYAVYSMVFSALRQILGQTVNGSAYILGNVYSRDRSAYVSVHDKYNWVYICVVFSAFTTAYWLITPFLSLYNKGINDANYLDQYLPLMFAAIELLSSCRVVDNELIKIALHAKETASRSLIEAIINIVVSLFAVHFIGMYGVLLGTIVALIYRTNDVIIYANKKILLRKPMKEYVLYFISFSSFALFVILRNKIHIEVSNYFQFTLQVLLHAGGFLASYSILLLPCFFLNKMTNMGKL